LENGKASMEQMLKIMSESGADINCEWRILDFGCAAGRMTRWLRLLGEGKEYWGVDVIGMDIYWARSALSKWFNFLTTVRLPHLPFEDNYFDFIFACSVFTHIDDLADAWVLELRRTTRKGGYLFLTLMDETTVSLLQGEYREHLERDMLRTPERIKLFDHLARAPVDMFTIGRSQMQSLRPESPQTFYRSDYIRKHWSKYFDVVMYRQQAYGYQSAIVLRKR
jgi:SAM-dependent methyltransferase